MKTKYFLCSYNWMTQQSNENCFYDTIQEAEEKAKIICPIDKYPRYIYKLEETIKIPDETIIEKEGQSL